MVYPSNPLPSKIRDITPTDYGVKEYPFEDGSTSSRLRSILPIFTQIKVVYLGVDGTFLANLLNFYRNEAEGIKNSFTLPSNFFDRHPSLLFEALSTVTTPEKYWRFESPPKVTTEVVNVYEVEFTLKNVGG